jgi:hypothetical protein
MAFWERQREKPVVAEIGLPGGMAAELGRIDCAASGDEAEMIASMKFPACPIGRPDLLNRE